MRSAIVGMIVAAIFAMALERVLAQSADGGGAPAYPELNDGYVDAPEVRISRRTFEDFDRNSDGLVDRGEADRALTQRWADLDRDYDGAITYSEFSAFEMDHAD